MKDSKEIELLDNIEENDNIQNTNDINDDNSNHPTYPDTSSSDDEMNNKDQKNIPILNEDDSDDNVENTDQDSSISHDKTSNKKGEDIPILNEDDSSDDVENTVQDNSRSHDKTSSEKKENIPILSENDSSNDTKNTNKDNSSLDDEISSTKNITRLNNYDINDDVETTYEKTITNNYDNNNSEEHNSKNNSIYVNYEVRIGIKLLCAIAMFIISFIFLTRAISINNDNVTYDELSTIDYSVCLNPNEHYREECLGMGMEYLSSITKNIPVTFNYNAVYTSKLNHDYKYYVKSTLKIFKPEEENKVLYTSSEILLEEKEIKNTANVISISESVEIPFAKYNDYVNEYNNKYSLDSDSYVEVSLYLDDKKSKKSIGKVVIPLSNQTFNITKDVIKNNNLVSTVNKDPWKDGTIMYAIVSCIFCLIGFIIFIRLLIFIIKSTTKKSEYNKKLEQILREYDRIIVQLKGEGYPLTNKRIIKVSSFLELLDARDTLEKPIVHVRVNNIKSEFYVEDMDKVYKYVMKESDFIK